MSYWIKSVGKADQPFKPEYWWENKNGRDNVRNKMRFSENSFKRNHEQIQAGDKFIIYSPGIKILIAEQFVKGQPKWTRDNNENYPYKLNVKTHLFLNIPISYAELKVWADHNGSEQFCNIVKSKFRNGCYKIDKDDFEDLQALMLKEGAYIITPYPDESQWQKRICTREVSSIIRDTKNTIQLKQLYSFKCQICGLTFPNPGNQKFLIEAHHIRPLGRYDGKDEKANLLILCPNHHTAFHRGVIAIDPTSGKLLCCRGFNEPLVEKKIIFKPSHNPQINLQYHLDTFFDKVPNGR